MEFLRGLFYNGNPWYTVGQILGLVIMAIGFFIYYSKKRSQILTIKLITDVMSIAQLIMIGAPTGAMLNGIAVFREIVFYNRLDKKWAAHRIWLWVFILLMGASPALTWSGPVSLLPAAGSVILVISFYAKNPKNMRVIGLFGAIPWLLYSIFTKNVGSILSNVITVISIFAALIRDHMAQAREKQA